jgi:hypothetical protein
MRRERRLPAACASSATPFADRFRMLISRRHRNDTPFLSGRETVPGMSLHTGRASSVFPPTLHGSLGGSNSYNLHDRHERRMKRFRIAYPFIAHAIAGCRRASLFSRRGTFAGSGSYLSRSVPPARSSPGTPVTSTPDAPGDGRALRSIRPGYERRPRSDQRIAIQAIQQTRS